MAEVLDIELRLKLDQLKREFAKLPGETNKSARKMVGELAKSWKKAEADAKKTARQIEKEWEQIGDTIQGALAIGAVAAAATELAGYVSELQRTRAEIDQLSQSTGIYRDTLAGVSVAVERMGGNSEQARDALADFGERVFDVVNGGGEAEEALRLLGFSVEELRARQNDLDGVLRDAVERYNRMEEGAQKNAVGQQLWSDASLELGAALSAMDLEDAIHLAERYGQTVSDEDVAASREWSAALADLRGELQGAAVDLGSYFDAAEGIDRVRMGFAFLRDVVTETAEEGREMVDRLGRILELATASRFQVEELTDALVDFAREGVGAWGDVAEGVFNSWLQAEQARGKFQELGTEMADLGDAQPAMDDINLALGRMAQETARLAEEQKKADAEAKKAASARKKEAEERLRALEKARKEQEAFEKEIAAAFQVAEDATAALRAQTEASNRELLDDEGEIQAAYQDRIDAIHELMRVGGDAAAATEAQQAAEAVKLAELAELERQRAEEVAKVAEEFRQMDQATQEAFEAAAEGWSELMEQVLSDVGTFLGAVASIGGSITDIIENNLAAQIDAIEERAKRQAAASQSELDSWEAQQRAILEGQRERGELSDAEFAAELGRIQSESAAHEAAIEKQLKAEQQAAKQAHKRVQALRIAQATVDSIAAGIALIPSFAFAGPAAPALAAAVSGTALAAAVSQIKSTPAPEFPTGFVPMGTPSSDHHLVAKQPEEAILNRRAVEARGGTEEVSRDNAGIRPTPQLIQFVVGRRTLAEGMVDDRGRARVDRRLGKRDHNRSR